MSYNRRMLLKKIIKIQEIVIENQARGVTQIWIYENIIKDKYYISIATFNNYLAINAKRELKKMKTSE